MRKGSEPRRSPKPLRDRLATTGTLDEHFDLISRLRLPLAILHETLLKLLKGSLPSKLRPRYAVPPGSKRFSATGVLERSWGAGSGREVYPRTGFAFCRGVGPGYADSGTKERRAKRKGSAVVVAEVSIFPLGHRRRASVATWRRP